MSSPEEVTSAGVQGAPAPEAPTEETPPAQAVEPRVSEPPTLEPSGPAIQEWQAPKPREQAARGRQDTGEISTGRAPVRDRPRTPPPTRDRVQPPELQPEGMGIEAAWSEIDRTTGEVYEELKTVQKARADATDIRNLAQRLLDEAETTQEEAERVMVRGRDSLAKAVSLNPRALRSVANTATALAEAMRTEWHLRQGIRQQAEEEADWAKQRATDAVLDALAAVRKVSNCVSRELEEASRTAATGESLKESSQNDLRRAQVMMAEAESLMRREARRLLIPPGRGVSPSPAATARPSGSQGSQSQEQPYYPPFGEAAPEPGPEPGSVPAAEEGSAAPSPEPEAMAPGQPPLRQLRPEIASTARLESLLDEFRMSLEMAEAAPVVDRETEPRITPEPPEPEIDTIALQDLPSGSPDSEGDSSLAGLEAALSDFNESIGESVVPGAQDQVETPSPQEAYDQQPAAPAMEAQPPPDQGQPEIGSTAGLEAALEEFLAAGEGPQVPAMEPPAGDSGGDKASESMLGSLDGITQLDSPQDTGEQPFADDLQSALNDFLRSVGNKDATPSTDDGVEILPAPGADGSEEKKPDLEDLFAGSQDQAESLAPETLESALSEFLQSAENLESGPAEKPVQDTPLVISEGLLMDNLDFASGPGESQPAQEPSNQEVGPAQGRESSIPTPPSVPQAAPPSQEEVGDDHFAQLRDSLAGLSSGEEPPAQSPAGINQELQVSAPPPGPPRAADPIKGPNGIEPPSASEPSELLSAEETYLGVLHILVTPGDESSLSFFWNVLDAVAGLGKVIDAQTPLPDGSGHEFILDLGNEPLILEQLQKQVLTSKIVALAPDRVYVQLMGIPE